MYTFQQELTKVVSGDFVEEQTILTPNSATDSLIEAETQWGRVEREHHRCLALLNVLASACEELGPACIKSAQQTLLFVKVRQH